jgi:hypothetical protein
MWMFIICALHSILLGRPNQGERDTRGTKHARGEIRKAYTIFLSENLKVRTHLEDLVVHGRIILKWILINLGLRVWTGVIQLRIGSNDGLL